MKGLKLTFTLLTVFISSGCCASLCQGKGNEEFFREKWGCITRIEKILSADNACQNIDQIQLMVDECTTLPEELKECQEPAYEYIRPYLNRFQNKVAEKRITCSQPSVQRTGRNGCAFADAANCVSTYNRIQAIPPVTLLNVFTLCSFLDSVRTEIQTCKNFVINCAAASDENVRNALPTIEQFVNYAEEMQSKGCECATKIYNCSSNILGSAICVDIERGAACAMVAADICVRNITFIFVQVDWLTLTVNYLRAAVLFLPFGCQVIAVGINIFSGSSVAQLSLLLFILALSFQFIFRKYISFGHIAYLGPFS